MCRGRASPHMSRTWRRSSCGPPTTKAGHASPAWLSRRVCSDRAPELRPSGPPGRWPSSGTPAAVAAADLSLHCSSAVMAELQHARGGSGQAPPMWLPGASVAAERWRRISLARSGGGQDLPVRLPQGGGRALSCMASRGSRRALACAFRLPQIHRNENREERGTRVEVEVSDEPMTSGVRGKMVFSTSFNTQLIEW